jgi:hypothetical protein
MGDRFHARPLSQSTCRRDRVAQLRAQIGIVADREGTSPQMRARQVAVARGQQRAVRNGARETNAIVAEASADGAPMWSSMPVRVDDALSPPVTSRQCVTNAAPFLAIT